ncbi:MAG: formylglycine-generating enzyme family protein, partial [Gammaproteobacteria bacterium]
PLRCRRHLIVWTGMGWLLLALSAPAAEPDKLPERVPEACDVPGEDLAPAMVVIPPGSFQMGSAETEAGRSGDEGPRHGVTIPRPFAMGRCEVTVGQFRRFVSETGYVTRAERKGGCYFYDDVSKRAKQDQARRWNKPGFSQGEGHPVVCVALEDAKAYIDWLSGRTGARYRLPTEAEWEYAARAETSGSRYWDDEADAACAFANGADQQVAAKYPYWSTANCDDGCLYTAPTGTYRPNHLGLYDMLANAWEWTADCWHKSYDNAPRDGSAWLETGGGDCDRRVVRGGSWLNIPQGLRSAGRFRLRSVDANDGQGFRLARVL